MKNIARIGLDFHGVIDKFPEFYSKFSQQLVANQAEVHIITGNSQNLQILDALDYYEIAWTHFYSIEDDLIERGFDYKEVCKSPNDPNCDKWFDEEVWDSAKGIYCKNADIAIHYDDSENYAQYFETQFILI